MTLKEQLQAIQQKAIERLEQAKETQAVEDIRIKYLGKKGNVTQVLKGMKDLSPEERPIVGKLANDVRDTIQAKISERKAVLHQEALNKQLEEETIDVTLPGTSHSVAQTHIILQVIEEIEDLFLGMGYKIVEGNEVETEHYNFERINVPKHHPARDMQDTFYIDESYLLRTQTSGTQPRTLEQHNFEEGPLKMISPGKVYRRDTDDATHSHQFHQIEGLVIDKDIAMTDLKGTLEEVAKAMFGDKHDIRLRPSYFPFTEPSVEVDVTCFKCQGSDEHCSVCKNTGWIEILGAGMVHPHVLEMSGVDPTVYGGFAFGLGPDRIAMLKHEIDDIRHFYTNDQRFLSQFKMKG
ncbi:phenylalanine--tRNA ligase subunit alpha [Dolosigranulum pigrum]|uniref:phenylalanine--tRNA ligase subunit alpha n=1 Tax=Dolosigranulum pigrum TaxID=29394 RepID=UPI001AD85114|nr:phenylalanine--tRNA ligase subunit alpha [Dolosigranulum pigrum]QTJ34817.1 phenylalanine--tRNA ligase subunit alpha [Dolosigranulum pigrum]QTJ39987.1 phenylalanine--tRNA ligase subunit alpha [Dolosigranulum pigrum]QTJ48470.1 phenylalanine--tRNA ligase subunit alpha [Dolosigranulum pigrum]